MIDMRKYFPVLIIILLLSCSNESTLITHKAQERQVKPMDLTSYSDAKPNAPLNLLFIHHSCGGQLFADNGQEVGENCIYKTHPYGGGLRRLLEENGYIIHEASYKSLVGDKTDICHWNGKFRDDMEKVLTCKHQDTFFTDGTKNRIVIFKSCFPNSLIEAEGSYPGDPDSSRRTTENYKAVYQALLQYFSRQPDTLFVVMTAPPLVKPKPSKLKGWVQKILGREDTTEECGKRARAFNNWLKDAENGWLRDYRLKNVTVFDYYDVLTGYGKSDWLMYPTKNGTNSHPSSEGNAIAAKEFVPLLNKSVHRMGIE